MSTPTSPYFFVSYSREDTVKQRRIVTELRERGLNIWVDIENLNPGTPTWEREIEKAIRGATGIIVLLSPESNNSEWVRREISFGEQHRKRIFPVLIEGNEDASTPLRLANHQRVDLRTKFESGLDELTQAIKKYIGVKEDIAAQGKPVAQKTRQSKPSVDAQRLAIPAVIALLVIGGAFAAFNRINVNDQPKDDAPATNTVTDVDQEVTEDAPPPQDDDPAGKIIYTCEIQGAEVCIINADGSNWKQLTDNQLANFNASLAPDSLTALYVASDGKTGEIYELNLATGKSSQITDLKKGIGSPEISPDNQYIVFHYQSGNLQLWMMNRDGSNPNELYSESGKDVHDATWSPDGRQLVFALGKGANNQLYTMDFNGRDPRLLNTSIDTRGRSDWGLSDLIVFDMGGPWAHDVYIMNADGSGLRQVSPNGMNAQGASLSPDGNWIAFTAYTNVAGQDPASCEIFIMRVDGTDMRQLTNNSYCDYQPRWGN